MISSTLIAVLFALPGSWCRAEDMTDCFEGWSAYEKRNYVRAAELTSRCIADGDLEKPNLARAWRNLGMALRGAQYTTKAIEAYDIAISLEPDDVWNDHVNRGNALSDIGKFEDALQAYDRASSLTTDHGEIYYNRGIVYERMNDIPKARDAFLSAFHAGLRSEKLADRIIAHGLYETVVNLW